MRSSAIELCVSVAMLGFVAALWLSHEIHTSPAYVGTLVREEVAGTVVRGSPGFQREYLVLPPEPGRDPRTYRVVYGNAQLEAEARTLFTNEQENAIQAEIRGSTGFAGGERFLRAEKIKVGSQVITGN